MRSFLCHIGFLCEADRETIDCHSEIRFQHGRGITSQNFIEVHPLYLRSTIIVYKEDSLIQEDSLCIR